jgi:predicted metalloprotease with PDZ domain
LPHEFVHSWNGKYRRPQGLATPDFQTPMKGELLWVYEGLTEYLGLVLTARAGLANPEHIRDFLALSTAALDNRSGREWRSLADTAVAAQLLYNARSDWDSERRGTDFYDEGTLLWLEVDTTIRRQSQGKKSIEDFLRVFHGGSSGPPEVKPYTFENLTEVLNGVVPNDWKGFFETRVNKTGTRRAPVGGIEAGGYRLAYAETMSPIQRILEGIGESASVAYSIGLKLTAEGSVVDVLPDMPGSKAGIGPGMKITAVNGRQFTPDVLRDAIRNAKNTGSLELLVLNGKRFSTYKLDYRDGEKYPVLVRNGQPALLDQILKPLTK